MMRHDRGATLVEYAMVVALLCVAIVASIQRFQDGAEDRYDDRGAQGSPTEEFGELGPSGGGSGNPVTTTTTTPTAVTSITLEPLSASATASNNVWSMTVTVRVRSGTEPLGGVTFTNPIWNPSSGGTTSCTTTTSGICTYTQSGMPRTGNDPSPVPVTFTIGSASYTNPDGTVVSAGGGETKTCAVPGTGNGTTAC